MGYDIDCFQLHTISKETDDKNTHYFMTNLHKYVNRIGKNERNQFSITQDMVVIEFSL